MGHTLGLFKKIVMPMRHGIIHLARLEPRASNSLRDFYTSAISTAGAGEKYENPAKGFESYFVTFADGVSLELMRRTRIVDGARRRTTASGACCHFAVSAAQSRAEVDRL